MNTVITIFLVLVPAAYLVALLLLYRNQSRHVYQPSRELTSTPLDHGYDYEDITFSSADGLRLNGWFVPCPDSSRIILLLHGNSGNMTDCIASISIFQSLGYSTFMLDYRGYGSSHGEPTEHGTYLDAEAAWQYLLLQRHYAPQEIVVLGRSLGAAIACWLTTHHTPRALIIESTFTSMPAIAAHTFRWYPARLLARYQYNTLENIRKIHCPVLVVHGRDDPVIPYQHGLRLYDRALQPKAFLDIHGSHAEGYLETGQAYVDGLRSFLATTESQH